MMRLSATVPARNLRSRQNERLKDLRQRLLRPGYAHARLAADGLIAIEGEHLLQEAVRSGLRIDTLFLREDRREELGDSGLDGLEMGDAAIFTVEADAFDHASATETPQGVAALVEAPHWSFDALLDAVLRQENSRLVVLAGLQDPGNVGTILRTSEAFGASGVLLTPASAHPWSQKVLRAAAGSSFRLPVVRLDDLSPLGRLREKQIPLFACGAEAGDSIRHADLRGPLAFAIGNEGAGIAAEVRAYCSGALHIPCPGPVESLNAAVAAAILLYEASRPSAAASIPKSGRGGKR